MKTSAPNWKPATLRSIVRASARQLEVRNTAWMVLGELLRCVNYRNGTARISTPSICENVGRCERSVKTALQLLRDTGVIFWMGRAGRGKTALYGFGYTLDAVKHHNRTCKRGAEFAPLSVGQYIEKEGNSFHKGVQNLPQRGAKIAPPSPCVSTYQHEERIEDAPRRGKGGNLEVVTLDQVAGVTDHGWASETWKRLRIHHDLPITFERLASSTGQTQALGLWEAMEAKEALRAAENEEGEKSEMEDAQ